MRSDRNMKNIGAETPGQENRAKYLLKKAAVFIGAMAAGALLAALYGMSISYAHEIPDETRTGTITVEMQYDSQPVTSGTLAAYRVGQIQEENGNYYFVNTEAFEAFEGELEEPYTQELAQALADCAKKHNIPSTATVENVTGKTVFDSLDLGLYLIVQTKAAPGYEPLNPFLVSVPLWEEGHYQYEVSAKGKFELKQSPKPEEPVTPTDPKLPQTGQLNWPVPILVISGLCLILLGWILCVDR